MVKSTDLIGKGGGKSSGGILSGGSGGGGGGFSLNPLDIVKKITVDIPLKGLALPGNVAYRVLAPPVREIGQGLEQLTAGFYGPSARAVAADKAAGVSGFRIGDLFSNEEKAGGDLFKGSLARRDTMLPKGLLDFGFRAAADPLNLLGVGEVGAASKGLEASRLGSRELGNLILEKAGTIADDALRHDATTIGAKVLRSGKAALTPVEEAVINSIGIDATPRLVLGLGKKALAIPKTEGAARIANELFTGLGAKEKGFDFLLARGLKPAEEKLFKGAIPVVGREMRTAVGEALSGSPDELLAAFARVNARRKGVGLSSIETFLLKTEGEAKSGVKSAEIQQAQRLALKDTLVRGSTDVIKALDPTQTPKTDLGKVVKALVDFAEERGYQTTPFLDGTPSDLRKNIADAVGSFAEQMAVPSVKNKVKRVTALDVVLNVLDDAIKHTVARDETALSAIAKNVQRGVNAVEEVSLDALTSELRPGVKQIVELGKQVSEAEAVRRNVMSQVLDVVDAQVKAAEAPLAAARQQTAAAKALAAVKKKSMDATALRAEQRLAQSNAIMKEAAKLRSAETTVGRLQANALLPQKARALLDSAPELMKSVAPTLERHDALVSQILPEAKAELSKALQAVARPKDASKIAVAQRSVKAAIDKVSAISVEVDALKSQLASEFGSFAAMLEDDALIHAKGAEKAVNLLAKQAEQADALIRMKAANESAMRMALVDVQRQGMDLVAKVSNTTSKVKAEFQSQGDKLIADLANRIASSGDELLGGSKRLGGRGSLLGSPLKDNVEEIAADRLATIMQHPDVFQGQDATLEFVKSMLALDQRFWLDMGNGQLMNSRAFDFIARTTSTDVDPTRFLKDFNVVTKFWRAQILAMPGFSNRNFVGGFLQNLQDGIVMRHYRDAHEAFKAYQLAWEANGGRMVAEAQMPKAVLEKLGNKYGMTFTDLEDLVNEIGYTFSRGVDKTGEFEHNRFIYAMEKIQGWMDESNPISAKNFVANKPTEAAKNLIGLGKANAIPVEMNLRMAHVMGQMEQGITFRSALDRMYYLHNDYNDLSQLDIMAKRFYPFWVWRTRNMARQAHLLMTTNAFGRELQIQALRLNEQASANDNGRPPFLGPSVLPTGERSFFSLNGVLGSADVFDSVGATAKALATGNFSNLAQEIAQPDALGPAMAIPLEMLTGRTLFSGKPIMGTGQGDQKWDDTLKYIASKLPVVDTVMRTKNSPSMSGPLQRTLSLLGPVPRTYEQP